MPGRCGPDQNRAPSLAASFQNDAVGARRRHARIALEPALR